MYPPDGLLTLEDAKHDVDLDPHIIAPDPFYPDDNFDDLPPVHLSLLTTTENPKMGEDEPSGLNGRLRPRKSYSFSPQTKGKTKPEAKTVQEKPKRTSTPSKVPPSKQDDFANKSDLSSTPQFLCPYCDKKFASKQTFSKHGRRMHFSSSKQDAFLGCLFCNHTDADSNIIRHMVDSHPNQYFACLDCHTRFSSTSELAEHKLNVCEKQKHSYRTKLRQKLTRGSKRAKKPINIDDKDLRKDEKDYQDNHGFNGIVISCELKPSRNDDADIEDNITTNLILPHGKSLGGSGVLEKNAVIVLDDIQQWNKRVPQNFSFHNTDADQILSRLGVVQRSTRTESSRRDWLKAIDDSTQKFEKCFDTKFYSKVASNVQENMNKFLDGSFNFNPDPDSTIKTRKSKNSVVINTAEGFPILLAFEQYSRGMFDSYLPRAIAPKHKWKWDNLENEKSLDQIKKDSHANNCIITLVSSLDIWTQLSMRQKFEAKFNNQPVEKKAEKQNILSKELKEILESRQIPTSSNVMRYKPAPSVAAPDFPASLGLTRATPAFELAPAVLSGEWVRPRSYVCCACGEHNTDSKALSTHISTQHPNAHVQHYEIVGEPVHHADILKHLYVPPSQVCNRTRPPRGFRECTKCRKSVTLEDLHQHMLDCAGDTPAVRRRQCRSRPFGVRRRRPRISDNAVPKKLRKDVIRSHQRRQKIHMRPRPRIRTEVGDAETIRKMLADLPAKRHRVLVNPVNMIQRPRRKLDMQRSKLIIKKSSAEDPKNRKRRLKNKSVPNEDRGKSVRNDDNNKNLSSFDDDEDNKPLKPRVKTVLRRTTRQRESLKSMANRAKRKSMRVEQQRAAQDMQKGASTSKAEIVEASLEDKPQKMDVKRGTYNTREQSNRGASNSRDEQRAGCSRAGGAAAGAGAGNSRQVAPPAQPVPLKHSIARLTADSETHDKSVQFHHLFLVQQECNNTNQHLPSGKPTLFENEAIVTRLDKPPLNFCQKGLLDMTSFQKNKLNKPRKGLNDCIAMLKNKLVDPVTYDTPGHVSVQCGNDDPIEPDRLPRPELVTKRHVKIDAAPPSDPCCSTAVHKTTNSSNNRSKDKSVAAQPKGGQQFLPKAIHSESSVKSRASRQVTQAVAHVAKEVPEKKTTRARASTEAVHIYPTNISPPKATETKVSDNLCTMPQSTRDSCLETSDINNHLKKVKPVESPRDADRPNKTPTVLVDDRSASSQRSREAPMRANPYPECIVMNKQTIVRPETERHPQVPIDIYTAAKRIEVPANIPPAHASTHVESMVPTPLDLSSRMDVNSGNILGENSYITGYNIYETLDLSNKHSSQDIVEDVVVDLRVKPKTLDTPQTTLDLSNSHNLRTVPDTEIDTSHVDSFPTDLSVKGNEAVMGGRSENIIDDEPVIYDLSATNIASKKKDTMVTENLIPTEFPVVPGKASKSCNATVVSSQVKETGTKLSKSISHCEPKPNQPRTGDDVSSKVKAIEILAKSAPPMDPPKNITEHKKGPEKQVPKSLVTRAMDKSFLAPKPVYDPTLIIPQYKIRANVSAAELLKSSVMNPPEPVISKSKVTSSRVSSRSSPDASLSAIPTTVLTPMPTTVGYVTSSVTSPVFSGRTLMSPNNRLESTTPVYTLANACITVTKIESPNTTTLSNTLLSIPGSTIASTAPVYTLTGTTIATPLQYADVADAEFHSVSVASGNYLPSPSTVQDAAFGADKDNVALRAHKHPEINKKDATVVDQDPETAKKIAMLPKELVEILGNMPVDHRNQLLNILPQYVSPSAAPVPSSAKNISPDSPEPKEVTTLTVNNSTLVTEGPMLFRSNILSPATEPSSGSQRASPDAEHSAISSNHSTQLDVVPVASKIASVDNNLEKKEELKIADTRDFSTSGVSKINVIEYVRAPDRIIDLTQEETLPRNFSDIEVPPLATLSHKEKSNCGPNIGENKQKCTSDKTASLRAVRIKAPSERQKESQMLKQASVELTAIQNVTATEENEVNKNKTFESSKSLAIQQAEVSSTQHPLKTVPVDKKYSTEVVSMDVESCIEETSIKSRRTSTPADTELETNKPLVIGNLGNKSILVTSSIPSNNQKGLTDEKSEIMVSVTQTKSSNDALKESYEVPISESANSSKLETLSTVYPNDGAKGQSAKEVTLPKDATEEEDSEDDIILAAIVKQKQIDERTKHRNAPEVKLPANSILSIKKKKKKKSKKVMSKSNSKKIESKETIFQETNPTNTKSIQIVTEYARNDRNLENNVSDITNNSGDVSVAVPNTTWENITNKDDKDSAGPKYCDAPKSEGTDCDTIGNHVTDCSVLSDIKSDSKSNLQRANDSDELLQPDGTPALSAEISTNVRMSISKPNKIMSKEKLKRKRKQEESLDDNLNLSKETLEKTNRTIAKSTPENVEETVRKIADSVESHSNIPQKDFEIPEVIVQDNLVLKKNKETETITKKVAAKELSFANDVREDDSVDKNKIIPLRRSRRGKSLYAESESLGTSGPEVAVDQKTPLTKKQLIFSKMLLEEESPLHSKDLSPVKENKNNDMPTETKTDIIPTPDTLDETDAVIEKCKTVKRKKSLQMKRKNKKKKSIDSSECCDESILTDDSMSNSKNMFESTEETETKEIDKLNISAVNINSNEQNDNKLIKGSNEPDSTAINSDGRSYEPTLEKYANLDEAQMCSSEKRKLTNVAVSIELSNGSKPKKSKLELPENDKPESSSDARVTTCYSAPVAARRTRSKSVVVKSSNALPMYDPYDIDLEDMVDTAEPLRQSTSKTRDYKMKTKSSKYADAKGLIKEAKSYLERDSEKKKEKKSTLDSKIEDLDCNETQRDLRQNKIMTTDSIAKTTNKSMEIDDEDAAADNSVDSTGKGNVCDSDDSTKSDVPLKKYVDEKNKLSELSRGNDKDYKFSKNGNNVEKQNNNKYEKGKPATKADNVNIPDVTDEQLRSEQFMESFGFFSERKPRKSNLLASKKISETFHIIADDSDDVYFRTKDRGSKKTMAIDSKKPSDGDTDQTGVSKKITKRGRKKKTVIQPTTCYCEVCKKEFRRSDNYLRHQMTLLHIARLSEIEMKLKTEPLIEEPNYLIAYKQHIDRLRMLNSNLSKRKRNSKSKPMLPTLEEVLEDVNKTVREQQLSHRGLSCDEALFLDCCELLKESHKTDIPNPEASRIDYSGYECATQSTVDLDYTRKEEDKNDTKSDGDVDSITAKTILESEEVRNLENDLISGLKEAASANTSSKNINFCQTSCTITSSSHEISSGNFSDLHYIEPHSDQMAVTDLDFEEPESNMNKSKKNPEYKDKMYPDIEEIDMFEDKFDKIKRKCRSQAAAAKQAQTIVKPISGHKGKKSEKKRGKKSSKKNYQNTVLTKGALKGFEGIKVSIPTSDINISAIVPPLEGSTKKKKKTSSKKKREKRDSETSSKYDSDHRHRDNTKVDVYEFMDNEDAELFEFRPSTLMERFKSISNKEAPREASKYDSMADEMENSSESASDGDDFVYMSDDYVCSDDETETSFHSCDLGTAKPEVKKVSPLKRKDAVEKNAVMGKIFRHNAVRSEKKTKNKDIVKPKANLDQLFDSLLEEEPNSSMLNNDSNSSEPVHIDKIDAQHSIFDREKHFGRTSPIKAKPSSLSPERFKAAKSSLCPKVIPDILKKYDYSISPNEKDETEIDIYGPSTSKKYAVLNDSKSLSPKKLDKKQSDGSLKYRVSSPSADETFDLEEVGKGKIEEQLECNVGLEDDPGVARQRARRKCTVGKQNVLAETWSSESEPDGLPPRPNSAESVVASAGRKKKGRKRDTQQSLGRRGKVLKKQDVESRVNSSNRGSSNSGAVSHSTVGSRAAGAVDESGGRESPVAASPVAMCPPPATSTPEAGVLVAVSGAPGGSKPRPRSSAYFWSAEGDDEQEHLQQHGWIVGDSHKKLVTMLAHAKGRKRNNDEKRNLVE